MNQTAPQLSNQTPLTPAAQGDAGLAAEAPPKSAKRVLVLGLGNDVLTDDAIGLVVARELQRRLADHPHLEVLETAEMGLSLLDLVVGFRHLVLIDAVQTRHGSPGFLHEMEGADLKVLPAISPHFLGVGEALALGKAVGLAVPERVTIFAVEVADPFTMGTELTAALQAALPAVVERVTEATRRWAAEE